MIVAYHSSVLRPRELPSVAGLLRWASAHAVFAGWAAVLDQRWTLRGIDLPPDTYRRLLAAMRNNPRVAAR
jgi:hypothetical protein